VLTQYVDAWFQKVARSPRRPKGLLVVDAFAGRGSDKKGNLGSPLQIARSAAMAKVRLEQDGLEMPVHVVAIELEREWVEDLQQFVKDHGREVEVLQGTLRDHHANVRRAHPGIPTLYFLDPFGLKGLEAEQVKAALVGEANEVLVLFNDPGSERLIGASGRAVIPAEAPPDLFDDAPPPPPPASEPTWAEGGACGEILDTAFGDKRWERVVERVPPGPARRDALIEEYMALLRDFGARYTTRIPVWNASGQREYTLVHASKHREGRKTMKQAVQAALNKECLPDRAKAHALLDMQTDLEPIVSLLWEKFEGKEVHWAEGYNPSIRDFVLQETDICHPQLPALEARLAGLRVPGTGREKIFRFTR
jgi:hypothetical protein